jgi:hypothetical protein
MAKFFVGQRVRIKWSTMWPSLSGQEGRIVGRSSQVIGVCGRRTEWLVAPDCWGSSWAPEPVGDAERFAPSSEQLEPILDQHQPCDAEFKQSLDDLLKRTERTNIRI